MIVLNYLSYFYYNFHQDSKLTEAMTINKERTGFLELYFNFYKITNQDINISLTPQENTHPPAQVHIFAL